VEYDLPDDLPPISGNIVRLQQVFLNIIINAEHAITDTDRSGIIRIAALVEEGSLRVTIGNNGPPIRPEIMVNIFDPFFTTKDVGHGTGLGLSTSYGIIKEHGGDITAVSEDDWTVFTITLPLPAEGEGAAGTAGPGKFKEPDLRGRGETVLVVDDEAVILKLLTDFFNKKGFSVLTASSGGDAMEKLTGHDVDFVISDIRMPGMNGWDFYDTLSKKKPDLINRLLFMTGDTLGDETLSFIRRTGVKHLKKPFSFHEITSAIQSLQKPR
jgi:two-component system NtrC family sensor kinase